jgi:hypothetical protein
MKKESHQDMTLLAISILASIVISCSILAVMNVILL